MAPGIAPASDFLDIPVLNGDGRGDIFTLAEGIMLAVERGAQIIVMSLGGHFDAPILQQAEQYAHDNKVLMVASVGNDGRNEVARPAANPLVLAVGAVDGAGNHAPFSNYGDEVDIVAPGFQVPALWDDDSFIYFDGTSPAGPLVGGVAAYLVSSGIARDPLHAGELIVQHADDAGPPGADQKWGEGILSVERLMNIGQRGVVDIAVAGFYPDTEATTDQNFPLYVSFQNRGTEYLQSATVELEVNGRPFRHNLRGMPPGAVQSIQIPVNTIPLDAGQPFAVSADVKVPESLQDIRPENNRKRITLSRPPDQ